MKGLYMDNRMKLMVLAALATSVACAMPTKQEIAKTRPLVAELMTSTMADYKSKTKSAVEVADESVKFAESAKSEAAQYLFLRGAVNYYVQGNAYGKAADVVEQLKSKIKDMPPSDIVSIISNAFKRDNVRKAPRLQAQLHLAQAQTKAANDAKRLAESLKRKSYDPPRRRQYAETFAVGGDWDSALAEFAKLSETAGKIARRELDGTAKAVEIGDFWWTYETSYAGGEIVFREHAANCYRKAIEEDKLDGLKKTLVEQRLASLTPPDADDSVVGRDVPIVPSATGRAQTPASPQVGRVAPRPPSRIAPSGLVHRWSFTEDLADSVGNVAPSKSDNATVENGAVALRSGSPLEFPAGTVPRAPFTVQAWVSATDKGLGSEGNFIFKIASSPDSEKDSVFWTWCGGTKWVSLTSAFGEVKSVGHGKYLVDGQPHLYTLTGEKSGKGMLLKFYQDDTCFGERTSKFAWKKPPALILGGFVTPTYDEVRIYSRALTHAEIIKSVNEGPEKVVELGKGK